MWMLEPSLLCRQHLLGEHKELHMLAGSINRGKRLGRFITDKLVDPSSLVARHAAVAAEMTARGYNHASPLPEVATDLLEQVVLDLEANRSDLLGRCASCRERFTGKASE